MTSDVAQQLPLFPKRVEQGRYTVPAVAKTLDIIEYIANNGSVSMATLIRHLGLPKTSVYQILTTLVDRGYLNLSPDDGRYSLSLRLYGVGNLALQKMDICDLAQPVMHELMLTTRQTCHMGILEHHDGVYIAKSYYTGSPAINTWPGKRFNLQNTAMGKILMAWKTPEESLHLLQVNPPTRSTPNTIIDPHEFITHLPKVKEQGWALDDEEYVIGLRCISAPVFGAAGKVVAALSLSGLSTEFVAESIPLLVEQVRRAANNISLKIGCTTQQ